MSGLLSTFNALRRALGAQQYAINTTSHNIANANTEGYSRQRVTMVASTPEGNVTYSSAAGPGQIGTGVEISEVTRARDEFVDVQIRNELSTYGKYTAREEFLSQIETIFMEPSENGISSSMNQLWDSWDRLSQNPQDSNARTGAVEATKTFTDDLNHIYNQLENLKNHSDELTKSKVFNFNELVKQIEDLNRQIAAVKITGNNPNDLLDKQDLLIDQLAEMTEIKVERGQYGEVQITASGKAIIGENKKSLSYINDIKEENGQYTLTYYNNGDTNELKTISISKDEYDNLKDCKLIWTDDKGSAPEKALLGSGTISGYASIYVEINEYKNQLNALAKTIAYAVNTLHNDGHLPNDTDYDYVPIFVTSGGQGEEMIDAGNITVNMQLFTNPSLIKTNAEGYPDTNGDKALAIAQLRDARLYVNEFYESTSSVVSGKVEGSVMLPDGTLTIKSNGMEVSISSAELDIDKDGTVDINEVCQAISSKIDPGMLLRVTVENNRLIIQSMKSEDNSVNLDDGGSGIMDSLKLYRDKNNLDLRLHNSIVDSCTSNPPKINDDAKGTTLHNYFSDTIAKLGTSAQQAKTMVEGQEALLGQLEVRKSSVSGVSLDEEMVNLIEYQHAYNAAARMITVVDELLDSVINLVR